MCQIFAISLTDSGHCLLNGTEWSNARPSSGKNSNLITVRKTSPTIFPNSVQFVSVYSYILLERRIAHYKRYICFIQTTGINLIFWEILIKTQETQNEGNGLLVVTNEMISGYFSRWLPLVKCPPLRSTFEAKFPTMRNSS